MALAAIGSSWAARITATWLFGGLLAGMSAGILLGGRFVPLPEPLKVTLAAIVAVGIMMLAGAKWARAVGRRMEIASSNRLTWAGALGFAASVIGAGGILTLLEPRVFGVRHFPIHIVYGLLFVPTAFVVAAGTTLALSVGVELVKPERVRIALSTAGAAALAFLIVYLAMDAAGWRVGAPEAARRATMLVVTALASLAATIAAGAVLGRQISGETGSMKNSST